MAFCTYITIVNALLCQQITGRLGSDIQITLLTDPLIIGDQAVLQCQSPMSDIDFQSCSWTKIRNDGVYDRLATTIYSTNISKYEATIAHLDGIQIYSLIIKDFNIIDFHCGFRCELEFDGENIYISVDEQTVISVPSKTDVEFNVSVQQKHIVGDFIIQNVYPDISCVVLSQTFHSKVIINTSTIIKQKFSKEVTVTVISSLRRSDCKGSMKLVCLVSNFTFNTEPYPFDVCSDEKDSNVPTTYIVISMTLVWVVVTVVLILHFKGTIRCFGTSSRGRHSTFFLEEILKLYAFIRRRPVITRQPVITLTPISTNQPFITRQPVITSQPVITRDDETEM